MTILRGGLTRPQIALILSVYLVVLMTLLDVNVIVIALPAMRRELSLSAPALGWVSIAYPLSLSALALSAGLLADRYGRKWVYLLGIGTFVMGSAVCAFARASNVLLLGRFEQGIGAAIAMPVTLALIAQEFRDPAIRAKVIGGWASVTGFAGLAGPVVGGCLVDEFGWPAIFLINIPIGLMAGLIGAWSIQESSNPERRSMDVPGQLLAIIWLAALAYGLIHAGGPGSFDSQSIWALAIFAFCLAVFIAHELRQQTPMLAIRMYTNRWFAASSFASIALGFSGFSLIFFLPTFLQTTMQYSATVAGILLLPLPAATVTGGWLGGKWVARSGPRNPMAAGLILLTMALLGLLTLRVDSAYVLLFTILLLLGLGSGLTMTATNVGALSASNSSNTGVVSAMLLTTRQTGTSIGIALLGAMIATATGHYTMSARSNPVPKSLGATGDLATDPAATHRILESAALSYVDALHRVGATAGTIALIAGTLVFTVLRRAPRTSPARTRRLGPLSRPGWPSRYGAGGASRHRVGGHAGLPRDHA